MISALDEMDTVVRCIEMGAADYLTKPFEPALLRTRLQSSLSEKRMRDMEKAFLKQIQAEQEKSEWLLHNILPEEVAERLKKGESLIADEFTEVTVLFSDIVGFTTFSARHTPADVVRRLNEMFLQFDTLVEKYSLEKIKTIGDAYMLVGGVPVPRNDHAEAVADMAIDMRDVVARLNEGVAEPLNIRIGLHSGPVVAGVIGTKKFAYDLWGDTVNTASRMESNSVPGGILISEATYLRLKEKYLFEPKGMTPVKGKGEMMTYLLTGRKAE